MSLAIALAGCGHSTNTSAQKPALPRAVANDLAAKSDQIADALDSGDVCGVQDELEQTATDLQNEVNCEEQKQDDKGKGKKKGHGDETTTQETTVSTTTEESN